MLITVSVAPLAENIGSLVVFGGEIVSYLSATCSGVSLVSSGSSVSKSTLQLNVQDETNES